MLNSVCFALDQSGSIGATFYPDIQQFTVNAAREIGRRTENTTYSAYGFASSSRLIQAPTTDLNGSFIPAVNAPTGFGGTNIAAGLQACLNALQNSRGNRATVLVTDGEETSGGDPVRFRALYGAQGIGLVTVGIGSSIDEESLRNVASTPDFYVSVRNTTDLVAKAFGITDNVCTVVPNVKPPAPSECQAAFDECEFTLAGAQGMVPTYTMRRKSDVAFTRKILSKGNDSIGVVNMNGIMVDFITENGTVPITRLGNPRFVSTHFKPFPIMNRNFASGIGHQMFNGNQFNTSKDKCIRVSFSSYQQVSEGPGLNVISSENGMKKKDNKCVVFQTN